MSSLRANRHLGATAKAPVTRNFGLRALRGTGAPMPTTLRGAGVSRCGAPRVTGPLVLRRDRGGALRGRTAGDLRAEPDDRVVPAARHALLHRDQRVVRDLDVLGADLGAALGDVAVPEAEVILRDVASVRLVSRVHLQLRD